MKLYREVKASDNPEHIKFAEMVIEWALRHGWLEPIEITEEEIEAAWKNYHSLMPDGDRYGQVIYKDSFKAAILNLLKEE